MVDSIEQITIVKNEFDISEELEHAVVARLLRAGRSSQFWFLGWIRCCKLPVNSAEVHRFSDDAKIMGDVKGYRVNRLVERVGVFLLAESAESALREFELCGGKRRVSRRGNGSG